MFVQETHCVDFVREINLANHLFVAEAFDIVGSPNLDLASLACCDYKVQVLMKIDGRKWGLMFARLVSFNQMYSFLMSLRAIGLDLKHVKLPAFVAEHESIAAYI